MGTPRMPRKDKERRQMEENKRNEGDDEGARGER